MRYEYLQVYSKWDPKLKAQTETLWSMGLDDKLHEAKFVNKYFGFVARRLGLDGWELVSERTTVTLMFDIYNGQNRTGSEPTSATYIFKRPITATSKTAIVRTLTSSQYDEALANKITSFNIREFWAD